MSLHLLTRAYSRQWHFYHTLNLQKQASSRFFQTSTRTLAIKPFILADIGEGIRECEIIQWFVQPEARVEEWDKLCEVQSDKASVEITSRFAGVIKKLHYEAGEMAQVGKALVDIDIQGEIEDESLKALTEPDSAGEPQAAESSTSKSIPPTEVPKIEVEAKGPQAKGKMAALATPAVRHLTKELNVDILEINGTGRDGRVLKEDIYKFAKLRDSKPVASPNVQSSSLPVKSGVQTETVTPLTMTQSQMFKAMTKSLSIPHFLYADEIDFTNLSQLRQRLNASLAKGKFPLTDIRKLSYMPFIIKAMSLALDQYPILNSRLEVDTATSKPVLISRSQHNIGIAMDSPIGLMVPVIKDISSHSIFSIASELLRLQSVAAAGALTTADLSGGTITLSNIGSIGGTYVAPVIVEGQVGILGMGKVKTVPAFEYGADGQAKVAPRMISQFSWSADHRVIDGATMARASEIMRGYIEDPETMLVHLR